jgi:hypothetical protein
MLISSSSSRPRGPYQAFDLIGKINHWGKHHVYLLHCQSLFALAALGEAVLSVLGCLVPFLEYDLLDSLPYIVASTLATFPQSLHSDTIELLCSNLLPMTLGKFFYKMFWHESSPAVDGFPFFRRPKSWVLRFVPSVNISNITNGNNFSSLSLSRTLVPGC